MTQDSRTSNPSPHTPGPWTITRAYTGTKDEIGVPGRAVCTVWTRKPVRIGDAPEADPEGGANARLIASAPDLLDLAKQYASECSGCDGTGRIVVTFNDREAEYDPCEDCADIRAVIAKAEGRS